jgi:hypothetical protein
MLTQLFDLLHSIIKISDQSTGQLHLVGKASDVVMIFCEQHHIIASFTSSAQKVAIL